MLRCEVETLFLFSVVFFLLGKLLVPNHEKWNHVVHEDTECVIVWFKCVCVCARVYFCGGVVWLLRFCGGVAVFLCLCGGLVMWWWCGGVLVVSWRVVFLCWCGYVFVVVWL